MLSSDHHTKAMTISSTSFNHRDGVSEGQFKQVLEQEIPEIEKVKTIWGTMVRVKRSLNNKRRT